MFEEKDIFDVTPSNENFLTWSKKDFINDGIREGIANADILIVPTLNFREVGPNFPPGTEDFLDYLKENISGFGVDICISDESYSMLELNSDYRRIGKFVVKKIALPVFIGVLIAYITYKVTQPESEKPQVTIVNNITNVITPSTNPVVKSIPKKKRSPHKYLESPKVTFTITVVDTNRSVSYHYEGPAGDVQKITDKIKETFIDGH